MLKLATLLGMLAMLCLVAAQALAGSTGLLLIAALALLAAGCVCWFSDRLILRMSGARQLATDEAPWLVCMVDELARRAQLPMPGVYIIDSPAPNAFATGRDPAHGVVAVTTSITQLLTRDELAGVIAHELAHIKSRDTLISAVVATLTGTLTMIATIDQGAIFSHLYHLVTGNQQSSPCRGIPWLEAVLLLLVAPLAVPLIRLGMSRAREYQADAVGAAILGDPLPLASALEKIEWAAQQMPMRSNPGTAPLYFVNPLSGRSKVLRLYSSHPPTTERVACLRALAHRSLQRTG